MPSREHALFTLTQMTTTDWEQIEKRAKESEDALAYMREHPLTHEQAIEQTRRLKEKLEKPMNQEGLNEEISKSIENLEGCTTRVGGSPEYHIINDEDLREFARHFAEWGAEHLASADKTSPKDIEEAADKYEQEYSTDATLGEAVIFGAEWQYQKDREEFAKIKAKTWCEGFDACKEQMMRDAVEYEVGMHGEPIKITFDKYVQRARGIFPGDKVRIIILPKED